MKSPLNQLLRWCALLVFVFLAAQGVAAKKEKDKDNPKPANDKCTLYPIALSLSSVSNKSTGAVLSNLRNGTEKGQFGWLSWTGNRSRDALAWSLTNPKDSFNYINPGSDKDRELSARNWVFAAGTDDGKGVREALDRLKKREIVVPVWYKALGKEEKAAYRVAGFAKVRLLNYDLQDQDTISVEYLGMVDCGKGNQPPIVYAGEDQVIAYPARANLNGSVTDDGLPANKELICLWSKVSGPGDVIFSEPHGATTLASFTDPGTYVLQLWASDGSKEASDQVTVTVNYANTAPVANAQSLNTSEDSALSLTLTGSDVDSDPLSFIIVTPPSFGALTGTAPNLIYTPAANVSGTDSFTFKANDGVLDSAVATVTIGVAPVNDAPVAYGQSVTTDEDRTVAMTLGGNDAEGTALNFTVLTQPAHGLLSGTAPNLIYTPAANHFGSDQFTFRVDDASLASAPATVTITIRPVNDAPVAQGDALTLNEDGAMDVLLRGSDIEGSTLAFTIVIPPAHGVLSGTPPTLRYVPSANYNGGDSFSFKVNDGGTDSDLAVVELTVQPVNDGPVALDAVVSLDEDSGADILLRGSDVEGDALTFSLLTAPAHGVLSGTAPTLRYVPNANYHGADSFTFTVSDAAATSGAATVNIIVQPVNDSPTATGAEVSLAEDGGVEIVLTGTDPEGNALTYVLVGSPSHGTLSGTAPNVRYVPAADYHGGDVFTFKVNDGELDSGVASVVVTVTAVNDVPLAGAQDLNTAEDAEVAVTLSGSDVDGDVLGFMILNAPANGTLTGTAPHLTYTPNADYYGSDSFAFRVNDGIADSEVATVSLTVTPVNDAPVARPQAVSASEDTPIAVVLTGSDIEDSSLTFAVATPPAHGGLSGTAPNLVYTPNPNFNGSDSFAFMVNDGSADSALAVVSLSVAPVNDPPLADSQVLQAVEAESTSITLTGSDVDGDSLSFMIVDAPANGTLSGEPPNLSYAPNTTGRPETDNFTFSVSDGVAGSTLASVTIDIIYNQPPVVSAGPDRSVRTVTETITLSGSASDDGLPRNSTLQLSWQVKFGPGTVSFGDASSAVTSANFSTKGLYILELSASDSQYTSSELVEVRVGIICSANPPGAVAWFPGELHLSDVISANEAVLEGATYGQGKVGAGFVFDGVDDRVSVAPSVSLDIGSANAFTVEFWMNSADVTRFVRLLGWHSDRDVFPEDQGVNIFQSAGTIHAQLYDTNNVLREIATVNVLTNNLWTHIAVTYDRASGQAKIYVNGAVRTISNLGNLHLRTSFPLFLGHILPDGSYFEGALDEVTLYTRALEADEIYEIFAANGTGKCPPSPNQPPVVDAGFALAVRDLSGSATLNGSATDDGLPSGASLRALWSVVSGPGPVSFADDSALSTIATFTAPGIYVLRLSVDDSVMVRSDVVEVRVATVCNVETPPGLVAWWPASGNGFDAIGAREARFAGGTSFTTGRVGTAFNFDGVNDSVRIDRDPALDVGAGSGFAIEFWMNSADVARNARLVAYHSGLAANGTNLGVNVFQFSGNLHVQIPDYAGLTHEFVATAALTANTWTHVAVTYDRTRGLARIYLNGAQRTVANVGSYLARTAYNVHLGNIPFDLNHYRGSLDEVSIYDRALDAQEVYDIFAAGATGKCPNDGNQTPVVNAGPDLFVRSIDDSAALNGVATDDGLPPGAGLRSIWSMVDGPGAVNFANDSALITTAAFTAPGTYVLQLTAEDGIAAASDLVEVRVGTRCTVNDPPGLVAWWSGNNHASDLVGANHARLASGATFGPGKVSSSFRFDGLNDVVQVPAHPSLDVNLGNGLSLEFWVSSTDVTRFARLVGWHFGHGTASTNFGFNIYQQSGGLSAQMYDAAGVPRELGATGSLQSNVWTHVAVTYDRTTGQGRIFINGALRNTVMVGNYSARTSYNLYFGNFPSDSGFFRGMLDEISLYDRTLDAQEIYEIYSSGATGKCPRDDNQSPVVNAGPDVELSSVNDVATLNGEVSDDGLHGALRLNWSVIDGPGGVTFGSPDAAVTTASFAAPGIYVLSLTADDAAMVRNDLVQVRVALACMTPATGLIAWWPGNATAQEMVGGRDGRLAGGVSFASGRVSSAFSFDGTNDSVHVAAHPTLDVGQGGALSIEFWVHPTDVTRNARMVGWHSGLGSVSTNFGVNVQMLGRTISAQIYDVAGLSHDMTAAGVLTNNTWTHVAVTYDRAAAQGRIYINGVLRTTAALGNFMPRTSYKLFFGNVPFDPNHFRGLLDEISIYDRALASNEVAAAFATGAGGKCPPSTVAPASLHQIEKPATVTENEHGQRISMTDPSGTTTYNYDSAGRVTRISKTWSAHAGAAEVETTLTYEYDELGRFVGVHSAAENGASMRYVWTQANQLREVVDPHSGSTVYHYNADGKAVSYTYPDDVTGSRFGVLDNIACYDESGASIICDADGNRVRRTVTDGSRTLTTYYIISPLTVTGAPQLIEELTFDSANPVLSRPSVTRVYVHGLHTISVEELVEGQWQLSFFE